MIDPEAFISHWLVAIPSEKKRLVEEFMSAGGEGRRYLFGRNEHSEALSKVVDVDGFIDDFAEPGSFWNEKPVLRPSDVDRQAFVVNCVLNAKPITAHKRIQDNGFKQILAYSDFCRAFPDLVPLPEFVSETRWDLHNNHVKWKKLSVAFFDQKSRQVLGDILKFRLTGDYGFMSSYTFRPHDQYFEDFLELSQQEVFVDAGGYNGDTTEEFCRRNPRYERVFLFEPSPHNLENARQRLKDQPSIEFIQSGLSDAVGSLSFNADLGSASAICETGSSTIEVTTLDEHVSEKVTFIKMDLEGWELKALKGSRQHIVRDHPKLAIAAYHHSSDFWRIFEFVIGVSPDYKVSLRHYTESWTESVMYFVPR